jgi:hypothetical protein
MLSVLMLNVVVLSVIMLNVVMLSAIMLNVVASKKSIKLFFPFFNLSTIQGLYSQHFILQLTNGPSRLNRLSSDKHSSLLGAIISYAENEVL